MRYHIYTVRGETTQNARTMNHCSSALPQIAAAISKNGASKMKMLAQSKTSRNGSTLLVPVLYPFGRTSSACLRGSWGTCETS